MPVFVVGLLLFLALTGQSDAAYCVCNSGLSDSVLQKNIDYACGNGADCSAILQNGGCYNPNTVKDHCNYAVNSYYQRKSQMTGSCDFMGTATVTSTAPSAGSGCVYQSSPGSGGTPTGGTGNGGTGGTGGMGNGGSTNTGTVPGSTPGFGLGPTGSGIGNPDGNTGVKLSSPFRVVFFSISLLISGFLCL